MLDWPLLRAVAKTGKPVIVSTGMASRAEIRESVAMLREAAASGIVLLQCTSAYPAPPESMHLRTIPELAREFSLPIGLSDHTMGSVVPVAAVGLGACVVEKHITLARADGGPDAGFSMEPAEFGEMVRAVRTAEAALGEPTAEPDVVEENLKRYRRSLYVVRDVEAGQPFTDENVKSIRPGGGLPPREIDRVIGRRATRRIERGTPLDETMIE
jgi:N-acetylneuraminate synthase